MGWASGTELGETLWVMVRNYIPQEERQKIAKDFYDELCNNDADSWEGDSFLEIDAGIKYDD